MTGVASRERMSAGKRPARVIDVGSVPAGCVVAGRATALSHFGSKLFAVGVLMAARAGVVALDVPVDPGRGPLMATVAGHHRMPAGKLEARMRRVLGGTKSTGPETLLRMAGCAFPVVVFRERAVVRVGMAISALFEFKCAVATRSWQIRLVTGPTLHLLVLAK